MKKKNLLLLAMLIALFGNTWQVYAQTENEQLYLQGKELYDQRKYAASLSVFEQYMAKAGSYDKNMLHNTEYYIAANSYALKQDNALRRLEDFSNKYPYSPFFSRACFMAGRIRYEDKKYKHAIKWYEKVKENELDKHERYEYLYTKGYSYLELKKYAEAKSIFDELKKESNQYQRIALYYSSYIDYLNKNNSAALTGFLSIENDEEYKSTVPYYIIQLYYETGNNKQAIENGKRLLQQQPENTNNSEIYRIMGECSYKEKNYAEAINYLKKQEKIVKKLPRNDCYLLGMSYYEQTSYKEASNYLTKSTTTNDSITQNAYFYLGNCYLKMGDKNKAKLAFESAAKASFDKKIQEESLYNYAITAYESSAAFGESISAFENFIEKYPNSSHIDDIYSHLADIFLTNKNYSLAYESLSKMKRLSPQMKEVKSYVVFQLGTQSFAKEHYPRAIQIFSESIKENAGQFSTQSLLWRGETYYRMNNFKSARADYQEFLNKLKSKTDPTALHAYYGIGYTCFSEKKYSESATWFSRCLQQKSITEDLLADVHNRMGDCYFYTRKFPLALNYYQQVINQKKLGYDYAMFQKGFILGLQRKYQDKINTLNTLISNQPKSEYACNALYEIGRSYVLLESNKKAIDTYKQLIEKYPKNAFARKASLEIGMLYFNLGKYDEAKKAYRNVIANYQGSEEARSAFENLESLHVETNDVQAFLDYCKTLGKSYASGTHETRSDSLLFIAAERIYIKNDYPKAIKSLENYLNKYGQQNTPNSIMAHYYLADSYYQSNDKQKALAQFDLLTKISGNKYMEESLLRAAEITYDQKNYEAANNYFRQLYSTTDNTQNRNIARLGILRCSRLLNENENTIQIASEIIESNTTDKNLLQEARYNRAKAYLALNQDSKAAEDLQLLSTNLMQENGAEAKYLYAEYLFKSGDIKTAEAEIFDFIEKNTPHQFWLARGFILLSDIYLAQKDTFQAKQYLISLKDNYTTQDSIQPLIEERLKNIEAE